MKTVIFDCDGVLVDSEVLSIDAERRVLTDLGLSYDADEYLARFTGLHDASFFSALNADHKALHGRAAPDDLGARITAARRANKHLLQAVAGADDALAATAGRNAVASSSRTEFLEKKLRRTGLWDLAAPHVYSADLVANGKPAPDIFLYAAEKVQASAADCIVIEDSVNGVKAGCAAGMTVWGFVGGGHCTPAHAERLQAAGAERVARTMADVTDWAKGA
ncbi:MAG: HAD-IA family hydrolase [Pseudomonadota bacterium]